LCCVDTAAGDESNAPAGAVDEAEMMSTSVSASVLNAVDSGADVDNRMSEMVTEDGGEKCI